MMPNVNSPVSVRVSPDERTLLEAAAEQAHTNLSDFVRRKAIEAAEMALLDQRQVTISGGGVGEIRGLGACPGEVGAGPA